MSPEVDKEQRRSLVLGAFGLGIIFAAVWAVALVFFPPGQILTIVDYTMYFVSIFIVGLPTFSVLRLYIRAFYSAILAFVIWTMWVFGVKMLFVWVISAVMGK